jgi:hypothetical protein
LICSDHYGFEAKKYIFLKKIRAEIFNCDSLRTYVNGIIGGGATAALLTLALTSPVPVQTAAQLPFAILRRVCTCAKKSIIYKNIEVRKRSCA